MQTTDGKIVYLLPSTMIQTPPAEVSLPSRQKTQQYLPSTTPLQIPIVTRLLSEPPSSNSNAVDPSLSQDNASFPRNHQSLIEQSYSMTRRVSSHDPLELPTTHTPSNLSSTEQQKLREVEALEAKLSNYQNVVEKYEKLAEDATTAAIDERKIQLRKLEEQLRKREQKAKNKLANAINVMEESQAIQDTIPAIATPQGSHDEVYNMDRVQTPGTAGIACKYYVRLVYNW